LPLLVEVVKNGIGDSLRVGHISKKNKRKLLEAEHRLRFGMTEGNQGMARARSYRLRARHAVPLLTEEATPEAKNRREASGAKGKGKEQGKGDGRMAAVREATARSDSKERQANACPTGEQSTPKVGNYEAWAIPQYNRE